MLNSSLLTALREKKPLIHNLTNEVVTNFTANGLYAIGAAPVMSKSRDEAAEMASISDGVLINIGTLTSEDVDAMLQAGKKANELGLPVVLDPVGVGATTYRQEICQQFINNISFTAIRGNAGEIATLIHQDWETRGVDSSDKGDVAGIAQQAAKELNTLILLTGETDVVSDGTQTVLCRNGTSMLTAITGSGCLLGSVLTAFLTLGGQPVDNAVTAVTTYGVASEQAVPKANGPGTFHAHFLDALAAVTEETVAQYGRVEQKDV
ncbi:hydroxyethylthiazole kinase [Pontibacillus salicampi]|uniref:Hydroxyethylthiazole kinase n=1 Tax=Pontibacillus salicampi TaxID=1449801 RepID=A0ABV6LP87_9BACI